MKTTVVLLRKEGKVDLTVAVDAEIAGASAERTSAEFGSVCVGGCAVNCYCTVAELLLSCC